MRTLKILGLASFAALAAMAMAATTASADSLCTTNAGHANECPSANLANGQNVLGKTSSAILLNEKKEQIESCTGEVLGNGSSFTQEGSHKGFVMLLQPLKFSNCAGICTKANGKVGAILLTEALTLDAWVTKDGELAPGAVLEGCFLGVTCTFELESAKQLLGISTDTLIANQVPLIRTAGSGLCPAKGFWDATYLVTKDEAGGAPLFVTSLP